MGNASIPRLVLRLAIVSGLLSFTACHVPVGSNRAPDGSARGGSAASATNPSAAWDGRQGSGFATISSDEREAERGSPVLPVFLIDLNDRQVAKGAETAGVLKVIEDHDGSLKDLANREASMQSAVSLEIHGDISATLAKKSYRLELVDHEQNDHDLPLLGLPPGSDWVLHSCGFDPTCLRNVLAYRLGRTFGHYAPRTQFIELFVNDVYQGLYVLVERVRRDKHRVDLPRPARAADGDITGGYIFKMDLGEGQPTDRVPRDWVSPVTPTVYSYHYPRFDEITNAQKAYLRDHLSRFEALMRSSKWNDTDAGYRRWLDLPSWVDFALLQELSLNPDAYFKSVYLQKWPRSMGDKIAIGPFWDFDLAFGVAQFRDARNVQAWAHTMNRFGAERVLYDPPREVPYVPEYWERLWTDPAFHRLLRCRWQELRKGPLRVETLNAMIDRWVEQLAVARPRDAALWSALPKDGYQGGDEALKAFLGERLAWMDANLPGTC